MGKMQQTRASAQAPDTEHNLAHQQPTKRETIHPRVDRLVLSSFYSSYIIQERTYGPSNQLSLEIISLLFVEQHMCYSTSRSTVFLVTIACGWSKHIGLSLERSMSPGQHGVNDTTYSSNITCILYHVLLNKSQYCQLICCFTFILLLQDQTQQSPLITVAGKRHAMQLQAAGWIDRQTQSIKERKRK